MRTMHGVAYWQVLRNLDALNHARRTFEQATSEEVKQEADALFAECYDWLMELDVPISYDREPKLWLLQLF